MALWMQPLERGREASGSDRVSMVKRRGNQVRECVTGTWSGDGGTGIVASRYPLLTAMCIHTDTYIEDICFHF